MAVFTIKYKVTEIKVLVGEADTLEDLQSIVQDQQYGEEWVNKVKTEYVSDKVVEILGTQEVTG